MAMQVGSVAVGRDSTYALAITRRATTTNATTSTVGTNAGQEQAGGPFFQEKVETLRAGFGDGTISGPTATARTLGQNLNNARQLVPDQESLRAQAQERLSTERQERARQALEPGTIDMAGARATAQRFARSYITQIGDVAAASQARLQGDATGQDTATNLRNSDGLFSARNQTEGRKLDLRA